MTLSHILPRIDVRDVGPATPKHSKPPKIPTLYGGGKTTIPDEVIAGIRWMDQHGWTQGEIAVYARMSRHAIWAIIVGQTRVHVEPQEPTEAFWDWIAARWV